MKRYKLFQILLLVGAILFPLAASANQDGWPWLDMCTATSVKKGLPLNVYSGGVWESEDGAKYVKLHTHLAQGVVLSKIVVESASGPWNSPANVFVNFDDVIQESEPNGKPYLSTASAKNLVFDFAAADGSPVTAHSITINFEKNVHPVVKTVHLFNEGGIEVNLNVPKVVEGMAEASSTLEPQSSYDVMNLFDSRYEYAWASNHLATGVTLSFHFKEKQLVGKVKIWNGYQRSGVHCYSNSRVKEFKIIADGQDAGAVMVEDKMGPQILDFAKVLAVQNLQLVCTDAYMGKSYKDLCISEMRFFDGKDWFMLSPLARAMAIASTNHQQFKQAGLNEILNESLIQEGTQEYEAAEMDSVWDFRFRPDGSFFMNHRISDGEDLKSASYVLGNYEIKSTGKDSIDLRIFGLLRDSYYGEQDCNGCGRDCNGDSEEDAGTSIFQDLITIHKDGQDFVIKHTKKSKKIDFNELRMHFE